ncbi:MAG: adenylate kinase, partial [Candidatus Diapherotrites archaeon CG_4_10_14_0_2_um_filter_31_5]
YVSARKGLVQISAGDLLRAEVKAETDLGKKAKEIMNAGELVPDELVAELVEKKIEKEKSNGVILDGYPRTLTQAELLEKILSNHKLKINAVINFVISDETTFKRIGGRLTCTQCGKIYNKESNPPKEEGKCNSCGGEVVTRDDDTKQAIKKRLDVYRQQTKPLIDYYKEKGLLKEFDAKPALDELKPKFDELLKELE